MPPPMSSLSALPSRLSITPSLSDTFEPPSTTAYGRSGDSVSRSQHLDLGEHQAAGGVRKALRDVVHARLLAVHDTEAVADERVAQRGQLVGERAALGVVLAGLAGVEPDVLEHDDVAVGHRLDRRLRRLADRVVGCDDVGAQQLTEPGGDRSQRVRRVGLARGSAEVRHHDHLRPARAQVGDGRDAGLDPALVGDRRAVERDVEVGPDEDALALQPAERLGELLDVASWLARLAGRYHVRASCRRS